MQASKQTNPPETDLFLPVHDGAYPCTFPYAPFQIIFPPCFLQNQLEIRSFLSQFWKKVLFISSKRHSLAFKLGKNERDGFYLLVEN